MLDNESHQPSLWAASKALVPESWAKLPRKSEQTPEDIPHILTFTACHTATPSSSSNSFANHRYSPILDT